MNRSFKARLILGRFYYSGFYRTALTVQEKLVRTFPPAASWLYGGSECPLYDHASETPPQNQIDVYIAIPLLLPWIRYSTDLAINLLANQKWEQLNSAFVIAKCYIEWCCCSRDWPRRALCSRVHAQAEKMLQEFHSFEAVHTEITPPKRVSNLAFVSPTIMASQVYLICCSSWIDKL